MTDFPRSVVGANQPAHDISSGKYGVPAGMQRRWQSAPVAQTIDSARDFAEPIQRVTGTGLAAGKRNLTIVSRASKYDKAPKTETRDVIVSSGKRRVLARSGNQDYAAVGLRDGMWGEIGGLGADAVPVQATQTNPIGVAALLAGLAFVGYVIFKG